MGSGYTFKCWVNAGSTRVDIIEANTNSDYVVTLYPSFNEIFTAKFVDLDGNILNWTTFVAENSDEGYQKLTAMGDSITAPSITDCVFDYWAVRETNDSGETTNTYALNDIANNFGETDITIYPSYKFNGDVNLIPVDEDGDGVTDSYQVGGYSASTGEQELVEIPGYVNGIPVTTINADAFSSYDDLHSIRIPATVTEINSQAFTADDPDKWGTQRDTVTLYYEGDPDDWANAMEQYNDGDYSGMLKEDWDNCMGESSAVFFLDENGKVDLSKGYWELANTGFLRANFVWQYHSHEYGGSTSGCSNEHNNNTNYSGTCNCDSCDGATRPDAEYWTTE